MWVFLATGPPDYRQRHIQRARCSLGEVIGAEAMGASSGSSACARGGPPLASTYEGTDAGPILGGPLLEKAVISEGRRRALLERPARIEDSPERIGGGPGTG